MTEKLDIPANWTFKTEEVASKFEAHVREQLPWYELVTKLVGHFARGYIPEGGLVYDIGASTGNIGRELSSTLYARKARLVAIENAESMRKQYDAPGELIIANAEEFPYDCFDVAIAMLSLMFIPVASRGILIRRLVEGLRPGGAIIIVDKLEPEGGYVGAINSRVTMAGKLDSGATPEEIIAKELSLTGVQRPLRRSELPASALEVFRFGDFAGFVIEGLNG
jgi:tRNA (cmo5U34)-methyltransferase